nr:hypothetical protein [Tanacetum cinerariifolium]
DLIIREQAERDSEIARINAERELEVMITQLDVSNKMIAKYLKSKRLKRPGIQLNKERSKKLKTVEASARINAERELEVMITQLDVSNKMIAKYLSEYEQAAVGLSHDEKFELINELLMYQRHLA